MVRTVMGAKRCLLSERWDGTCSHLDTAITLLCVIQNLSVAAALWSSAFWEKHQVIPWSHWRDRCAYTVSRTLSEMWWAGWMYWAAHNCCRGNFCSFFFFYYSALMGKATQCFPFQNMYYRQENWITDCIFFSYGEKKLHSLSLSSYITYIKSSAPLFTLFSLQHTCVLLQTHKSSHFFIWDLIISK